MMSPFDRDLFVHDGVMSTHQMRGLDDVTSITFRSFFSDNRQKSVQHDLLMNDDTSLPNEGRMLRAHSESDGLNGV